MNTEWHPSRVAITVLLALVMCGAVFYQAKATTMQEQGHMGGPGEKITVYVPDTSAGGFGTTGNSPRMGNAGGNGAAVFVGWEKLPSGKYVKVYDLY